MLGLAVAWTVLRGIDHRFVSFSDGVYTYLASAVAEGGAHHLYGRLVLSQPPAVVLSAAALWKLSPHVETIRAALAALGALTALLTYALARANRLSKGVAVGAALLALTAPVRAQFSGLDGEVLLAPLALGLGLALHGRRPGLAGVLVGAGFFVKLTWAPFAIAGLVVAARDRTLGRSLVAAVATAGALYTASVAAFGWRPGDLLDEIVLGQSGSGLQLGVLGAIATIVALMWWPYLLPALVGVRSLGRPTLNLMAAGLLAGAFAIKQGTFFNVLDPVEPFLAVAAAAGAVVLWRKRTPLGVALLAVCAAGMALHVASVADSRLGRILPVPVGAAVLATDDEQVVDRAVAAIRQHSAPRDPVLVNPLLAVLAGRREVSNQADWFILHALGSRCSSHTGRCVLWARMKRRARDGRAAVVTVDSNVKSFDPSFPRDTGTRAGQRILRIDEPPLDLTLFARSR